MNIYLCCPGCKITRLKNTSTFWNPKMHSSLYALCCSFKVELHSHWYIQELILPCLDVWSCIKRYLFNKPFVSCCFVAQGLILACHTLRDLALSQKTAGMLFVWDAKRMEPITTENKHWALCFATALALKVTLGLHDHKNQAFLMLWLSPCVFAAQRYAAVKHWSMIPRGRVCPTGCNN